MIATSDSTRPIGQPRAGVPPSPGRTNARTNVVQATRPSSAISAYMRVSCAYCVSNGLAAASTAAVHPARSPNIARAPHHATGIEASANSSESAWVASSVRPANSIQKCSSM